MRSITRNQQLIILFCAFFFTLTYFIHRPYSRGSSNNPTLIVEKNRIYIEILGEVKTPGIYSFHKGVSVHNAIKRAGGLKESLTIDRTSKSVKLKRGDKVSILKASKKMGKVLMKRMDPNKLITLSIPIDINAGTREELSAVPGLNPGIASSIIEYRGENGDFSAMEELINVKGIGKVRYKRIKGFLTL